MKKPPWRKAMRMVKKILAMKPLPPRNYMTQRIISNPLENLALWSDPMPPADSTSMMTTPMVDGDPPQTGQWPYFQKSSPTQNLGHTPYVSILSPYFIFSHFSYFSDLWLMAFHLFYFDIASVIDGYYFSFLLTSWKFPPLVTGGHFYGLARVLRKVYKNLYWSRS